MISKESNIVNEHIAGEMGDRISDFIPIACHYDSNILITKSSDLLVTIALDGLPIDQMPYESVRSRVRAALLNHIDTYSIAAHLHVVRESRNIIPKGVIPFGLPAAINNAWCKYNNWDKQLMNTLYITLIYQRPEISAMDPVNISSTWVRKKIESHWEKYAVKLQQVADSICNDLKNIGARKLAIIESKNGFVSEPLSFYYYLTHFKEKQEFVQVNDLAEHLSDIKMEYKFNSIRINDADRDHHVAVYTIKETPDVSEHVYKALLQVSAKFIISEVMIFVDKVKAMEEFKDYLEILQMGRSSDLAERIGLKSILDADKGRAADFCLSQVNIIVHSEDGDVFERSINRVVAVLQTKGLLAVREDFNMARCFWTMLPGNFKFISRARYGATANLANFSSVYDMEYGNFLGSKWGPPISLFRTEAGVPFYFNFHNEENGNTLVVGPVGNGKTTLCQFLLSQSVKVDSRVIYVDMSGEGEEFVNKMGGSYTSLFGDGDAGMKIFPFSEDLFYGQPDLLKEWLYDAFLLKNDESKLNAKPFIERLVIAMQSLATVEEKQKAFVAIIDEVAQQKSINVFSGIMQKDIYEKLFSEDGISPIMAGDIVGIGLSKIEDCLLRSSVLKLWLLKIAKLLDGSPTIIFINKAASLFEPGYFNKLMAPWLQQISAGNGIAILELENNKDILDNPDLLGMTNCFGTKLFTTKHLADKQFKRAYDLSEEELKKVRTYTPEYRMFLIKQREISLMASFYMDNISGVMGRSVASR